MRFTHPKDRTIAAICTPPGIGAMAALRLSGPKAFAMADNFCLPKPSSMTSHTACYGKIFSANGEVIDTVMILPMKAPKSYTGEDTVEIFSHGGDLIPQKILRRMLEVGADAAQGGEFTLKAYLNKKIDLAQAEAVEAKITAQNELALRSSTHHLEGRLSKAIEAFQKKLIEKYAILEAWVDFPEEDLAFEPMEILIKDIQDIKKEMQQLAATFREGKKLTSGIDLCLLGAPNAGKSSLMNALLGKDRAIVTEIAGTTRDLLEEKLSIGQLHFQLTDTAGIRKSLDRIEEEGIERAQMAAKKADLVIALFDTTSPIDPSFLTSLNPEKTLFVFNKIDLTPPPHKFPYPYLAISAKENIQIDELKRAIFEKVFTDNLQQKDLIITSSRHQKHLEKAIHFLDKVIEGLLQQLSCEFIASDMRASLEELDMIIGRNITEDLLSSIFSTFCIGK